MHLLLTRQPADGKSVRGLITSPEGEKLHTGSDPTCSFPTLENADYLIPCGTYPLTVTYSPRFKRPMPLVCGVKGRDGIRFHPGTKPEHSKGCILVTRAHEDQLRSLITSHTPVTLTIR